MYTHTHTQYSWILLMTINHAPVPDSDHDTPTCMHTCIHGFSSFQVPIESCKPSIFKCPRELSIIPSIFEHPTIHLVINLSISWSYRRSVCQGSQDVRRNGVRRPWRSIVLYIQVQTHFKAHISIWNDIP